MLMQQCLPAAAALVQADFESASALQASSFRMNLLESLPSLLLHRSLWPAVQRCGAVPGAAAAVEHAAAIIRAITAEDSCEALASTVHGFGAALASATALLGLCCEVMDQPKSEPVGGSMAAPADEGPAQLAEAGWHVAALLPDLAAAMAALEHDPKCTGTSAEARESWVQNVSSFCRGLLLPLRPLHALQLSQCSPKQVSVWVAAATAGLRLLPSLGRLDSELRQHNGGCDAAAAVTRCIVGLFVDNLPRQLHSMLAVMMHRQQQHDAEAARRDATAWNGQPAQLWALHTTLCRLIAALTAPQAPLCLPGVALDSQFWRALLLSLHALLFAVADFYRHAPHLPSTCVSEWHLALMTRAPK